MHSSVCAFSGRRSGFAARAAADERRWVQDEEGRYMAELVVHDEDGAEAKHEAENLQRDILKMDTEWYDELVLQ
jgi:hypothetical protein